MDEAKKGVVYLERIPPFMKVGKVRHIMSRFGEARGWVFRVRRNVLELASTLTKSVEDRVSGFEQRDFGEDTRRADTACA